MQLLDSSNQSLSKEAKSTLDALQDIARNLELKPNFCIHHPEYKPFELTEEVVKRISNLPEDMQNRYWSLQLSGFLYGIYYNGSLRKTLALDADNDDIPLVDLENNTFLGVDLEFYERLHDSNSGDGYFDSGWMVIKEESDDSLVVAKGELKLYIERDREAHTLRAYRHLQPEEYKAVVGDSVAIRLPKNLVQNGFYMAVSNAGAQSHGTPDNPSNVVRVYFNLTPEGTPEVMGMLTQQLNPLSLPFSFKVLYNPGDYNRFDSGVLYFDKSNYEAVKSVLEQIYTKNQSHFKSTVPLFTKVLAPGLGLAEEPDSKFSAVESFGTNRCQIIANGLLEAWQQNSNSPEDKLKAMFEHFSVLGLDWQRAYLNANSEDIYTPLDICK